MLDNLVKESEKPVPKPKTILDDLDSELLYEKTEPILKKPKIKSIEVLAPPKSKNETINKELEKSKVDTENFNFDDFGADDFSDMEVQPATTSNEVASSVSSGQSTDKITPSDNLNQYIGDVSYF